MPKIRFLSLSLSIRCSLMLLGLAATGCNGPSPTAEAPSNAAAAPLTDDDAAVRAAFVAARIRAAAADTSYRIQAVNAPDDARALEPQFTAHNAAVGLDVHFGPADVRFSSTRSKADGQLALVRIGCGDSLATVAPASPLLEAAQPNRVTYAREAGALRFVEWWANGEPGIEQGFVLPRSPCGGSAPLSKAELSIELDVKGLTVGAPAGQSGNDAVELRDGRNVARMRYGHLYAHDADGRALPSRMAALDHGVSLRVDISNARFPIDVDPLVETLDVTLQHVFPTKAYDWYGIPLAVSGDTAVLGAQGTERDSQSGIGAAYVFTRTGSGWVEQQMLKANDGQASDGFGSGVAIDGDTIVIGAYNATVGAGQYAGAGYVFVRSNGTWTQQAKLVASDTTWGRSFGESAAVDGDTVLLGTRLGSAAYVFVRSGVNWSQQQKLTIGDGHLNDNFGGTLALNGDTALVGANGLTVGNNHDQGGVYVFVRSGAVWSQQAKLLASDGYAYTAFGDSVAVEGDTAMVGSRRISSNGHINNGEAYVFTRTGNSWAQTQQLWPSDSASYDSFGAMISLSGNNVLIGSGEATVGSNDGQGAAYIFSWNGAAWVQQKKLVVAAGVASERCGWAGGLDGDKAVIGCFTDAISSTVPNKAYAFEGNAWTEQPPLVVGVSGQYDRFGTSVSILGDTAVVGAPYDSVAGQAYQGSAYVFTRSATGWSEQQMLVANDGATYQEFGHAVRLQSNMLFVTALHGGPNQSGSVYVFAQQGGVWTQVQKLLASDAANSDQFGSSLSGDGNVLAVAADQSSPRGAAYVFTYNGSRWSEAQRLTAPGTGVTFNGSFATGIGMSADLLIVGCERGGDKDEGAAYVYQRNGSTWVLDQRLTPKDGVQFDGFGHAVAISGNTVVVTSPFDDQPGGSTAQGSAYVFVRDASGWSEQGKLLRSPLVDGDWFGDSADIQGDTVVVGGTVANVEASTAFVFVRSGTVWQQDATLLSGALGVERFGYAIALDGDSVIVGAPEANVGPNLSQGRSYVFRLDGLAGQACTNSNQCATPYACVDGVCCTSACTEACGVCSRALGATKDGTCSPAPDATPGAPACAGNFLCDGQSLTCPSLCSGDSDCSGGRYCNYLGLCLLPKPRGASCNVLSECAQSNACTVCETGKCVDGFCCDSGCNSGCDTCAASTGATDNGVCGARLQNLPGSPNCAGGFVCDGASVSCPTTCTVDANCLPGYFCDGTGACLARQGLGVRCNDTSECAMNLACVDNVCCGSACTGACSVCSAALGATLDGVCTPSPQGTMGGPACAGDFLCDGQLVTCPTGCDLDSDCSAGRYCSSTAQCLPSKTLGAACDAVSDCRTAGGCNLCTSGHCVDGVCCDSACDGACDACSMQAGGKLDGQCAARKKGLDGDPSCAGNLLCDGQGVNCPDACASQQDCQDGFFCTPDRACKPAQGAGASCGNNGDCDDPLQCVDGVCCNSLCDKQCEACDVKGSEGTCSPTAGDPHGARPGCGGTDATCVGRCDGQKRDGCAFADFTQDCGVATCSSAVVQPKVCNGAGDCIDGTSRNCAPFGCNDARNGCESSCRSDADCAAGAVCNTAEMQCALTDSTCADLSTLELTDGSRQSCAPYICEAAHCLRECQGDAECLEGSSCMKGKCSEDAKVAPVSGGGSRKSGGCSVSPAGSKQANALSWWFVLACAAAVLRRARAARSMGVVLFVALSMLGRAQAQSDKALAESLFDSGRELMAQRRYDEACAKLSESQRIDASSGTALNLALCWEQLGRTASAWAEYLSAARLAAAQSRLDRVEEATAKAHALEARLSYLTVRVESAIPGELLYRAQVPLAEAAWGIAAPVDPGVQVIIAKADGYQSYQKQVVVGPSGDRQVVVIPALMRAAAPVLEQPVSASAPAAKPAQARAPQGGGHLLAYVLGGIGIAALGASVGVGLWSKSRYDAAAATCGGSVGDCAAGQVSAAREDRDRAEVLANVSNAAGAVGVLGVGTAIVLFILSGDEDSSAARSNALSWTASATSGRGMLSLTGGF